MILSTRSGVSEMEQRPSPSSLRKSRPSVLSTSKSSRSLDRKPSIKIASFDQEEEEEEKWVVPSMKAEGESEMRIKTLEAELQSVKESESKMLESLMSQTKQLEETKIELEEAKLEVRTYLESNPDKQSKKSNGFFDPVRAQKEILQLKAELKSALSAEEKSKKAMDDLAAALKEVALEANRAKEKLGDAEAELLDAKAGAEYTYTTLRHTEEKLRLANEQIQRLKMEAEESTLAWSTKQEGFRECVKVFEEDINRGKDENAKLINAQRGLKDEISKMRDIMKHALNEATVVKEALEIARNENSQLKDSIAEKDHAIQRLEQEFDSVKVSEAAALGSVEGLKNLLAARADAEPTAHRNPKTKLKDAAEEDAEEDAEELEDVEEELEDAESTTTFPEIEEPPLKKSASAAAATGGGTDHKIFNHRKFSDARSESLRYPTSHSEVDDDYSVDGKPRRLFSSLSNICEDGAARAVSKHRALEMYNDDHSNKSSAYSGILQAGVGSSTIHGKKKPIFRKFTDILRRRHTFK